MDHVSSLIQHLLKERDEAIARAKTAEKALVKQTPDGSEFYKRDGDGYRVDVEACLAYIAKRRESQHNTICQNVRARKSLETENASLREECRAKGETIAAMQGRVDWAYTLRDAAVASHEGQKRNTEAFMRERDEARAENASLKEALEDQRAWMREQVIALWEDTEKRYGDVADSDAEGKAGAHARGRIKEAESIKDAICECLRAFTALKPTSAPALTNTQENKEEGR
ncbi:hypothetical protein [Microvirga mediterraneensis]|uniref:Uncharacterized protein n=1 Tax=Microvirga mediterraneensis TaxID=2754695 RepID=A0A838BWS7_9HYPH|nr:hypothetical protein [Microvirga mediterraneensis]MBA1159363.1 hypothetical protein [Microvirga mediterraneensis]